MKKTVLLSAAFFMLAITSFAQSSSSSSGSPTNGDNKNFHFGLNVMPGLYWLKANSSNNASNNSSFGFGYGVNLEFYFTQNYGFVTGLEVTSFGAKYTNTETNSNILLDSTTAHDYKLQYLEIPLGFKFKTQAIGLMKYFGVVGLNPGIRLKATDDYTVTIPSGSNYSYSKNNVSINSETSIVRLAFTIGAGFEYNMAGTTSLQVAVNYDNGFLNINSDSKSSILSKGVTLTVGILF